MIKQTENYEIKHKITPTLNNSKTKTPLRTKLNIQNQHKKERSFSEAVRINDDSTMLSAFLNVKFNFGLIQETGLTKLEKNGIINQNYITNVMNNLYLKTRHFYLNKGIIEQKLKLPPINLEEEPNDALFKWKERKENIDFARTALKKSKEGEETKKEKVNFYDKEEQIERESPEKYFNQDNLKEKEEFKKNHSNFSLIDNLVDIGTLYGSPLAHSKGKSYPENVKSDKISTSKGSYIPGKIKTLDESVNNKDSFTSPEKIGNLRRKLINIDFKGKLEPLPLDLYENSKSLKKTSSISSDDLWSYSFIQQNIPAPVDLRKAPRRDAISIKKVILLNESSASNSPSNSKVNNSKRNNNEVNQKEFNINPQKQRGNLSPKISNYSSSYFI